MCGYLVLQKFEDLNGTTAVFPGWAESCLSRGQAQKEAFIKELAIAVGPGVARKVQQFEDKWLVVAEDNEAELEGAATLTPPQREE